MPLLEIKSSGIFMIREMTIGGLLILELRALAFPPSYLPDAPESGTNKFAKTILSFDLENWRILLCTNTMG